MFNRSDMRGLNLCSTTTVDQPQSGDRTAFAVGPEDSFPEVSVTHGPVGQLINALSRRQMLKRYINLTKTIRCTSVFVARKNVFAAADAALDDPDEVFRR